MNRGQYPEITLEILYLIASRYFNTLKVCYRYHVVSRTMCAYTNYNIVTFHSCESVKYNVIRILYSVSALHIYDGAAPCSYCFSHCPIYIAPCRNLEKKMKKKITYIIYLCFQAADELQCLQICAHVFIDRPKNCARVLFRSRAGLCLNFGRSRVKVTWSFAL